MNIAVFVNRVSAGTGLYRLYLPHEKLGEWGHEILFTDIVDPSRYEGMDIFICSKSFFDHAKGMIPILRKMGIKTIIDYDDYWVIPQNHYLYRGYKRDGTATILSSALRLFDYVTCTTPILASEIRKINKNVEVFENAIDPNNSQFSIDPTPSKSVRFGWIGGHCHLPDISLIDGEPQKLRGNFEIHLFGHDRQKDSIYTRFAVILSGDNKLVRDGKFKVHAGTDARRYTQFYNMIDVALAPLAGDRFNSMKSELKVVEAGFMKKALIVSNVRPYSTILTDKNCLKCTTRTHWSKNMQKLINNPSLMKDLSENLCLTVKDKFDLDKVTRRREEWYKSII